jgi:hypothetical protein
MTSSEHSPAKRWRPWQFSLRLLMLLMFGVETLCAGWTANDWKHKRLAKLARPTTPTVIAIQRIDVEKILAERRRLQIQKLQDDLARLSTNRLPSERLKDQPE